MWLTSFKKIDKSIKPYLKTDSKKKIPVIISYKENINIIKSRIISSSGKIKYEYINIKAISSELPPINIDKLSENPEVKFITLDFKASLCLKNSYDVLNINSGRKFNLTGKNVGIGIIDTGVFPHPELQERRNAISFFSDLINGYLKPYDDNGHGTFISGCIASQGEYPGIAPDSSLYMIKAFDSSGNGFMSDIIKGIDILITSRQKYNLRIICLPFEFPYLSETSIAPLIEIIKKAIELNILVMACSGNLGSKPYTIYPPGSIKDVITVGGADCNSCDLNNIRVSGFSGRGPLLNGTSKPDIIAPCANITSLSSNTSYIPGIRKTPTFDNKYRSASGTSIACAIMSGICALILEKDPNLTSNDLKSILTISAQTTGESKYSEGSGLFNFEKIIK